MKVGAIILAAGESQISNIPMIKKEITTLRDAEVNSIVVLTGYEKENVERELAHRKVSFVHNPKYKTSKMLKSIQLGLEVLKEQCDKVICVPADIPSFTKTTLETVISEEGEIVIPLYKGKKGHPICVDMVAFDKIINYKGKEGLRGMTETGKLISKLVKVEDPGILIEADSENAYNYTLKYQKESLMSNEINIKISVSLGRTKSFLYEELFQFLKETESCGSMNKACKKMNIAYSRGWKMVNYAEEQLGFSLVERQAGGNKGGKSKLTEKGQEYLKKYAKLCKEINKSAEKRFKKIFSED